MEGKKYFVDEQCYGSYSLRHYQHHFKEINGCVEMTYIVYYKIAYWFLGDIANNLLVEKQLKQTFDFRRKRVAEIFV